MIADSFRGKKGLNTGWIDQFLQHRARRKNFKRSTMLPPSAQPGLSLYEQRFGKGGSQFIKG